MSEASEYAAMRSGALLIDRGDRVRIRFGGPRAAELVTGLVTSDVLALAPGEGQYSGALTAKGKISADVRIFADADGLFTDTSARAGTNWRDIVKKYINPRVAPYRDVTAELSDLAVIGPKSRRVVAAATGADEAALSALNPYGHLHVMHGDARVMIARNAELDMEAYEVFVPMSIDPVIRDGLLAADPTLVQDFVNATVMALAPIAADPQLGVDAAVVAVPSIASDTATALKVMTATVPLWTLAEGGISPLVDEEAWTKGYATMQRLGFIDGSVPLAEMVATGPFDEPSTSPVTSPAT